MLTVTTDTNVKTPDMLPGWRGRTLRDGDLRYAKRAHKKNGAAVFPQPRATAVRLNRAGSCQNA